VDAPPGDDKDNKWRGEPATGHYSPPLKPRAAFVKLRSSGRISTTTAATAAATGFVTHRGA